MLDFNPIPDIMFFSDNGNPTICSPNATYQISFYQTRETLNDPEIYEAFIHDIVKRFRRSVTYTNYKHFLMSIGLNHCQVHGNINSDMATLEMHHNILTIFDITMVICEHLLNTIGRVCSFDVITLLKKEHTLHHIPLIMLSQTPHQLYHDDANFWIDPKQCTRGWNMFLETYYTGITRAIAWKVINYLEMASIHEDGTYDNSLLDVREHIINWSEYNSNTFYKGAVS